jgi:hypothetical protein
MFFAASTGAGVHVAALLLVQKSNGWGSCHRDRLNYAAMANGLAHSVLAATGLVSAGMSPHLRGAAVESPVESLLT